MNNAANIQVTVERGSIKDLSWVETIYYSGPGRYARVTEWSHGHVDCMAWSESANEMVDAWGAQRRTAKNAHALARRCVRAAAVSA